jgi:peptidoglycan/LPS O-acetylase OafA/YrhL
MAVHTPMSAAASDSLPAAATPIPRPASRPLSRLAGVDGLRAAAALWVVLFHIKVFSGAHLPFAPLDFFARSGSTGVSLFLVLSGFCLYMPFAAGRQGRFKTSSFFVRRARRLLPAYYCSLGLALAIAVFGASHLGFTHLSLSDIAWQIATHTTMFHTLFPSTFYALNGAYWSLGLEWQLYLALPLLIVGMVRFGLWRTLAAAVLVNVVYRLALAAAGARGWIPAGTLQSIVLPNQLPGRWAEFVFGMAIAELYARGTLARLPRIARYAWVPMTAAAVAVVGQPLSHLFFGAVFALLLVAVLAENGVIRRIFSWQPLVALGIMSYSIYLVHQPLVQALAFVLRDDFGLSPTRSFVALIALLPVILAVAWVLFVLVERYTLSSHPVEISGRIAAILFPKLRWRTSLQPAAVRDQGPDEPAQVTHTAG